MELLDFLTPSSELSANGGPEDHVVLSSRVRLARNISGVPFPGRAKKPVEKKRANPLSHPSPRLPPCGEGSLPAWAT